MLALIGVVLVSGVFLLASVVAVMTFWGAREQRRAEQQQRRTAEPRVELKPTKQSGALLRQVNDSEIELEIRSGRVLNAIRLYQEKTGANAKDARVVVEAWRDRLSAS
jgi:flagellar basal body-associated protein FliL